MAKSGNGDGRSETGGCCRGWLLGLGAALLAAAGLVVCGMCLDARRGHQLAELTDQLGRLQQLVDKMQLQLDSHENKINTTLHSRSAVNKEPAEEVVYEDEYEYDEEGEENYEYENEDEEKESNSKATVKRTVVGDNSPDRQKTNFSKVQSSRMRRDVNTRPVTLREDRYVPSAPHLKNIFNSKRNSEGLRIYATYFGKASQEVGPPNQFHHLKNSVAESSESGNKPGNEVRSSNHRTQQHLHRSQSSNYQEQRRPSEIRIRHQSRNRNTNERDVEFLSENSEEESAQPGHKPEQQCNILAAHFVGDATRYNSREHFHYFGNNILYHPHGLFQDWVPSDWMFEQGTNLYFPMLRGKLSIQRPGIYFVYAQVYYAATHDRCGFHIKHNQVEVAQCLSMTSGAVLKRKTCFTAAILHLQQSDQLWISEVEGHRNTSFKSSHSFFGLIQLRPT